MRQKMRILGVAALTALSCSFALAQDNHNDAAPTKPLPSAWDTSSIQNTPQEQKNIELAKGYYRDCVQSHHPELWDKFLAKDEINHNPNDPKTPEGLMALLHGRFPNAEPLHKELVPTPNIILAKGNLVLLAYEEEDRDPKNPSRQYTFTRFEMVRIENGKIQEHWDVGDRRATAQSWKLDWCAKSGRSDCPTP